MKIYSVRPVFSARGFSFIHSLVHPFAHFLVGSRTPPGPPATPDVLPSRRGWGPGSGQHGACETLGWRVLHSDAAALYHLGHAHAGVLRPRGQSLANATLPGVRPRPHVPVSLLQTPPVSAPHKCFPQRNHFFKDIATSRLFLAFALDWQDRREKTTPGLYICCWEIAQCPKK